MGFSDRFDMFLFILLLFSAFHFHTTVHCLRPPPTTSPVPASSAPDSIEDICNLTTYPAICISTVTPRLPNPSMISSVLLVLVEYAKNETTIDMATFHDLGKNPKETPNMLAALKECEMWYQESLEDYNLAIGAVKGKDWSDTRIILEGNSPKYFYCANGSARGSPPPVGGPWVAFNLKLGMFVDDCYDLLKHLE